jgi:excisionase family DNA binding protein
MATWLTLEDAAKHLKIGKSTIYRLARAGDLPAHRVGRIWRFDVEELDSWLKSGRSLEKQNPKSVVSVKQP